MTPLDFGKQLRTFRLQCRDSKTGKTLSQQQLGEFLREELGVRYSGAAVSDWERNESKINVNDRLLLISLVKILKRHGGIKTLADANLLLEAGNYRAINIDEKNGIFPEEPDNAGQQTPLIEHPHNPGPPLNSVFFNSPVEFQKILAEEREGPPPVWPRVIVAVINKATSQWNIFHSVRFLVWLWIWLLTYLMIAPSLQWPFDSQESSQFFMGLYGAGSILIPLLMGGMVGVKNNSFWRDKKTSPAFTLPLYMVQGASIGFHVGYFFIFSLSLTQYYFQAQPSVWGEIIKMLIPLFIGYAGAHLVPYNLWRAYGGLHLKDGGIFFIFIILGPLWAWFFLEFYEILITQKLGVILILLSATIIAGAMAIQYRRKGNTIIPLPWVILFYGLIFICQIVLFFIK
ncbi:MAG: hypothetical protein HOP27_00245 [Anaerolineales bacterium]|nr:hypothetical protein [Anaerolineales bacterium]